MAACLFSFSVFPTDTTWPGPIKVCTCTKTGTLKEIQSEKTIKPGVKGFGNVAVMRNHPGKIAINNMCAFACPYDFCPSKACASETPPNAHFPYVPNVAFDSAVPFCFPKDYDSIEALYKDLDNIGEHCGPQYVLQMAWRLLRPINTRFDEIMKGGYDGYFKIYAQYVSKQAPAVLFEFLKQQSDRYFTCEVMEEIFCCPGCQFKGYNCRYCQYGDDVCVASGPWGNGELLFKFEKKREPCPPQYQERGQGDNDRHSIYWTLRSDKEEDFYKDVEVATGAKKEFIQFPERIAIKTLSTGCIGLPGSTMPEKCYARDHWYNAPVVSGFGKDDVTNPKEAIEKGLVNMAAMQLKLMAIHWEVLAGTYAGEGEDIDVVDAVMLPIFMFQESLKSMEEVVTMAKEIKAAQEKEFILHMLSTVFFVVGAVGGALASAGRPGVPGACSGSHRRGRQHCARHRGSRFGSHDRAPAYLRPHHERPRHPRCEQCRPRRAYPPRHALLGG